METWLVELIIGIASALFGFLGGFFTKTYQVKIRQNAKGNNNKQQIGDIFNGK